jgi:hypothetical protein
MIANKTKFVPPAKSSACQPASHVKNSQIGKRTCQLVKFEAECDGEEKELICDRNEESDRQVVVIEDVDFSHFGNCYESVCLWVNDSAQQQKTFMLIDVDVARHFHMSRFPSSRSSLARGSAVTAYSAAFALA